MKNMNTMTQDKVGFLHLGCFCDLEPIFTTANVLLYVLPLFQVLLRFGKNGYFSFFVLVVEVIILLDAFVLLFNS